MISIQSNILVVDQELFFRKLYLDLLAEDGYQVEVCDNGDKALELLDRQAFDLVLTEIMLPGTNGLDILRTARTLPDSPEVILVTRDASLETAIAALKNGARDYLLKPFNPEEFKHIVRSCLEQRKLLTENDQLRRQIQLFQRGQSLSSLIDLERLIPQALDVLMKEMKAESGCAFILRDGETPYIADLKRLEVNFAAELVDWLLPELVVATGLVHLEPEGLKEPVRKACAEKQLWVLPLGDGEVLKGGLIVFGASDLKLSAAILSGLHYLCDQVALGFENACRYRDAQRLMYTDDLTGLYNHRYMQVALGQEIRRSQRYGLKFSLLFLDLDRFKAINDEHGHLAGSAALKEVGQLLRDCVRDVDTLFRFGGDEFAALLVETDGDNARIVAERIRKVIEGYAFLEAQGTPCFVTVTSGYATFPTDAANKERLLDLADRAMYAGKEMRNVIFSAASLMEKSGL